MTAFNKADFRWDGMYLMYEGEQGYCAERYDENAHPTRVGKVRPMFIARFKYGNKPYKTWINFLVKNFTVEEYATRMSLKETPLAIMESKGFIEPSTKKMCRAAGYPETVDGFRQMIRDRVKRIPA